MKEVLPKDQIFIRKLTEIVIANLGNENFGVRELVLASGMSLYTLVRRLHSINKKTANQFIREVRLQKALEMLRNGEYSASEIAYKTGFGSPSYFNKCFRDYFGYPPGQIKKGDFTNTEQNTPVKSFAVRFLPGILLLTIALVALIYFGYQKIKGSAADEYLLSSDGRISLAVMPFQNMTNNAFWDVWQDGIQSCLITSLSNSEELKVSQIETLNGYFNSKDLTDYASITPSVARSVSRKLDATVFMIGSISQADTIVRLNAQLVNSKTEESIKSFQIDGTSATILHMIDSLSILSMNSLIISKLKKESTAGLHDRILLSTNSPEAYRHFIQGNKAFYKNDFPAAIELFKQALAIDSGLVTAMSKISLSYYNEGNNEQAKYWCLRQRAKLDRVNLMDKIWAGYIYAIFFETPFDRIKYLEQLKEMDDQNPLIYFNTGDSYLEMNQYDKAITEFKKAIEIFNKRDTKPFWGAFYYELGIAYHKTGQYKKEKRLYQKADKDFPDDPGIMDQHAWLALTLGDTAETNHYIRKWTAVRKEESWSDARIAGYLAYVYDMAGDTEKIEMSLRQALSLEPENPARISSLANFLIDYDQNITEGMQLIEKALELKPDNFTFLHNKGWGLYKQGKYWEARDILQKSWDLRLQNSIYNHKAFLHLEEAKKAIAGMKGI